MNLRKINVHLINWHSYNLLKNSDSIKSLLKRITLTKKPVLLFNDYETTNFRNNFQKNLKLSSESCRELLFVTIFKKSCLGSSRFLF